MLLSKLEELVLDDHLDWASETKLLFANFWMKSNRYWFRLMNWFQFLEGSMGHRICHAFIHLYTAKNKSMMGNALHWGFYCRKYSFVLHKK